MQIIIHYSGITKANLKPLNRVPETRLKLFIDAIFCKRERSWTHVRLLS